MKYKARPVVIEAVQLRWDNWGEMCDFADVGKLSDGKPEGVNRDDGKIQMAIPTLEGIMLARENDFIIRGTAGELYPCKPKIFAEKYEAIPSDAN